MTNLNSGLVLHLKMSEGSGTVVHDSSGNDLNGFIVGVSTWGTGKYGSGITRGNNVACAAEVPDNTLLDVPDKAPYTWSAWINLTAIPGLYSYFMIMIKHESDGDGRQGLTFFMNQEGNGDLYFAHERFRNGSAEAASFIDNSFTYNVYHHYVVTYDGIRIRLYLDKVLKATSGVCTLDMKNNASHLTIMSWGGNSPASSVDDVRVYNRALSANEIKTLYTKGP